MAALNQEEPAAQLSGNPFLGPSWKASLRRFSRFSKPVLLGTSAYLLVSPLLALLHECLLLLGAEALGELASLGMLALTRGHIPLDPVYTGTLFQLISDVTVSGVAVSEPVGPVLHELAPAVFDHPDLVAEHAWASAVIEPNASVIARSAIGAGSNVTCLVIGLLLVRVGLRGGTLAWRARSSRLGWLAVTGALLQAHVVLNHLADEPMSLAELEATGLTYGVSVLFAGSALERPRVTAVLDALPDPLLQSLFVLAAVVLAYAVAFGLVFGPGLLRKLPQSLPGVLTGRLHVSWRPQLPSAAPNRLGLAAFALLVAASPLGSLTEAESRYLADEDAQEWASSAEEELSAVVTQLNLEPATSAFAGNQPPDLSAPLSPSLSGENHQRESMNAVRVEDSPGSGPSTVTVSGRHYKYSYSVSGQPQVIRGMGYNPVYSHLSREERATRFDRDFALMRALGVNTLMGWATEEFDGLLLDKAHEYGLGVVPPYDLDPELDYTDPGLRQKVLDDVLRWIDLYKEHPGVRMWGLGNEVLHKLIFPSWMHRRGDPVLETRADAFAEFFVELIDAVRAADPDHPIIYRDAEEAYLPRLRASLTRDGLHRPWLVYGINIYTPRIGEVIASWPTLGLDAALLISEFGPGGAGPTDRPHGYREMWATIRAEPESVLGGAPYVWTTEGPEEVDRIFGLVDGNGRPVDRSLPAIGRLFRDDLAQALADDEPPARHSCDDGVARLARKTIADLQSRGSQAVFQASQPPSVMGSLDALALDPLRFEDLRFERIEAVAPTSASNAESEWAVTWAPPSQPGQRLLLLLREGPAGAEIVYVYRGPGPRPLSGWSC